MTTPELDWRTRLLTWLMVIPYVLGSIADWLLSLWPEDKKGE